MSLGKSNILINWFNSLLINYNEFISESKNSHCKIVKIETDIKTNETILFILINGIKKQIIPFSPMSIVTNDSLLNQFSPFDVRAITFYALTQTQNTCKPSHFIFKQEFMDGKTIFVIKNITFECEEKKSAHELYCDNNLLANFNHNDLKIIISTAIQEQTIEDFQAINGTENVC